MTLPVNSPANGGPASRELLILMVALIASVALAFFDLWADLGEGAGILHLATEAFVVLSGAVGLGVLFRRFVRSRRRERSLRLDAAELSGRLEATRKEAIRWREKAHNLLAGLGAAIDDQFSDWRLTPAEKEIGLLLLKGLSHREIAAVREVSEATVRQQARSVYKKAGVRGRNDLSAFFLEDLLLPI